MKQFTSFYDVADLEKLLALGLAYKHFPLRDKAKCANKKIGLLFFNPSMRTRISTQVAAQHLGMQSWAVNAQQDLWNIEFEKDKKMDGNTQEHIVESIRVMSRYCDVLGVRTFPSLHDQAADDNETILQQIIQAASVPVVSLESATLHPLQSFADLITIKSKTTNKQPKVVLTWSHHVKAVPHCVANSLSQWFTPQKDMEFIITHPKGYALNPRFTKGASITEDQDAAIRNADFIYVKNWSSYEHYGTTPAVDGNWMLTKEKIDTLAPQAKVMHCLPVRRDVELASSILESPYSIVTEQAENRIYAAQAVLHELLAS